MVNQCKECGSSPRWRADIGRQAARIATLEAQLARAIKEREQLRTIVEAVLLMAPVVFEGIDNG